MLDRMLYLRDSKWLSFYYTDFLGPNTACKLCSSDQRLPAARLMSSSSDGGAQELSFGSNLANKITNKNNIGEQMFTIFTPREWNA